MVHDSAVVGRCWISQACVLGFWTFGLWAT